MNNELVLKSFHPLQTENDKYGSNILDSVGLHHKAVAIKAPVRVPRVKPITVSRHDTPRCLNRSPEIYKFLNVPIIRQGLLIINGSIQPRLAASSQSPKNRIGKIICAVRTIILFFFSDLRYAFL